MCPRREHGQRELSRIDEASQGVSVRENANQSNLREESPLSWPTLWHIALCPRREWSRWEASDMDVARRASAWVMRESIEPEGGTITKFTNWNGAMRCVPGGNRTHI